MNERIKELAERAGEYVNSVYTPPVRSKTPDTIWEDGHVDWHTQFNQKFAELIVQEMCSVLDKAQWDKGEDWVCADGTRIIPQIKEHFGVEE